jgi:1,4-dihydroxy-2-naphthoyl-CoA hydrolase
MPVYGPNKRRPFGLLPGEASMVPIERLASLDTYNLVDQQNEVAVGLEINAEHLRSKSEEMVTATKTLLHKGCKPR